MTDGTETNNSATVAMTLGILSLIVPFIGLVLGIIGIVFSRKAVKEIERTSDSGRGLATAGLICSIVGIVVQLLVVLGLLSYFMLTTTHTVI